MDFDAAFNLVDATLDRSVTRGHTGRTIRAGADYELAREWGDAGDITTLVSHHGADRFRAELRKLLKSAPAEGDDLTCFRGRPDDPTINSWRNMGPPPSSSKGGRYNAPGVVALYLCDSRDGVLRELTPRPETRVFIQEYRVPTLRLADFSSVHLTDFVQAVFDIAESCCVMGRIGPSNYDFSRVVGQLIREAGFEGMIGPGVRGDKSFQYRNVVAFDLRDEWQVWSLKDSGFSCMVAR
jgi:RES domain